MSQLQKQVDGIFRSERPLAEMPLTPDIVRVIAQNNLEHDLAQAIALANGNFTGISSLTAELEIDPDTDEERVVLHLKVSGPIADVVKARQAFTKKWIASALPPARDKIVLLYHIV